MIVVHISFDLTGAKQFCRLLMLNSAFTCFIEKPTTHTLCALCSVLGVLSFAFCPVVIMNNPAYHSRVLFCVWFLTLFFVVPWFTVVPLSTSGQNCDTLAMYSTPQNRRQRRRTAAKCPTLVPKE